jgi:hypothetical protein
MSARRLATAIVVVVGGMCLALAPPACGDGERFVVRSIHGVDDAMGYLDSLRNENALGGVSCQTPECRLLASLKSGASRDTEAAVAAVLTAVRERLVTLDQRLPGVLALRDSLISLEWQWRAQGTALRAPQWQVVQFKIFAGKAGEIDVMNLVDQVGARSPDSCTIITQAAVDMLTLATVQYDALSNLTDAQRRATVKHLTQLDGQWHSFLASAPGMFPWELFQFRGAGKAQAKTLLFPRPPTHQWLVAHPQASLQFANTRDDELEDAVVLEVLGYARWSYRADDSMTSPIGASVFVAWDGHKGSRASVGLFARLSGVLSIGVGYRSEDGKSSWPLYASGDLAKLVTNPGALRGQALDWLLHESKWRP